MFRDRVEAGRQLAKKLTRYANRDDVLVLGIPRGGVPVAFEVAQALHAPLDILLVRKLGTPGQQELAMGAVASGGVRIFNQPVIEELQIPQEQILEAIAAQEAELERREQLYRGVRPGISVRGKIAILVDDGVATGSSMLAAISALRTLQPKKIVAAVPVASPNADQKLRQAADEFVCGETSEWFISIGQFYEDFSPTEDADVHALLERAAKVSPHKSEKRGAA